MKGPSIAILEQTPGIVSGILVAATKEQMDWQPSADRWSISMVLAHLADVETHGFMQRFRAMAAEESPFLPSYNQLTLFATGNHFDGREQLDLFRDRRRSTLELLASLPESAAGRSGRHEELGVIQVGELLHESWILKRSLSDISLPAIDEAYEAGLKAGASGGKLLGAGQGGFLLLIAKPENHDRIQAALPGMMPLKVGINAPGSRVIFAQGD